MRGTRAFYMKFLNILW